MKTGCCACKSCIGGAGTWGWTLKLMVFKMADLGEVEADTVTAFCGVIFDVENIGCMLWTSGCWLRAGVEGCWIGKDGEGSEIDWKRGGYWN
jgi:hypothetical protein